MVSKSLGQLEEHAFFVLFMAFIIVLFWHGVWGLADNTESYVVKRLGFKKEIFNVVTIMAVIFIVGLYPQILGKF
jgi:succinate dehydrogenase hydrophobic anchor subunit